MSINRNAIHYLLLLLSIILIGNLHSHMTIHAMSTNQIYPTKEWKVVGNHPTGFPSNSGLTTAAALSAGSIWAVGYVYANDSAGIGEATPAPTGLRALTEQWNGDSWHIVNSPIIPGASYVSLSNIVALSNKNMWAVGGSYTTDYDVTQQLIEHWDGTAWHIIKPPALKDVTSSNLFGITAPTPNDIWVVGGYSRPEDH